MNYQIAGYQIAGYDEMGQPVYVGGDVEDLLEVGAPVTMANFAQRRAVSQPVSSRVVASRAFGGMPTMSQVRASAPQLMRAAPAQAVIAQRVAQNAPVLLEEQPQNEYEWPLGFDSGANIAAGASATIIANPQVLFRGKRLVVPGSIASLFTIDDVKIGNQSMFPTTGAVPAEVFSNLSVGVALKYKTAQVTMQVSIDVTNISGAPARFRAAIVGDAVQ